MLPNPLIYLAAEHSIWKCSYLPPLVCSMLISMTAHCDVRETYGFAWIKNKKKLLT